MQKTLLYSTAILSGLALSSAAMADNHAAPQGETVQPPAVGAQEQDRTNPVAPAQSPERPASAEAPAEINPSDEARDFSSFKRSTDFSGPIADGYSATELIGADIVGPNDETIGEIADLLIDENNEVRHVLVEVGGFLGIGEKHVALDLAQLTRDGDNFRTSMTEEQLEAQATYVEEDNFWTPFDDDDDEARPQQ